MTDRLIRPSRTDTFEHTISGLLTKRAQLRNEGTVAYHGLPIELVLMEGDMIAAACGVR